MADQFTVPEDYELSFRRILPYLAAPLQNNPHVLESLTLYLKLGGEKMARIAIDAFNVTQRLQDAEIRKQLREQELLSGDQPRELDDDEDEDENENENENENDQENDEE